MASRWSNMAGQIGVVGGEHQRPTGRRDSVAQGQGSLVGMGAVKRAGGFVGQAPDGVRRPGPGRSPPAAAGHPTAARAGRRRSPRPRRLPGQRPRPRVPPSTWMPRRRSGSVTFSSAVSSGISEGAWNTIPIVARRRCGSCG